MKNVWLSIVLCALALPFGARAQTDPALETDLAKFSYALGLQIARNLTQQGLDRVDADALALAVGDVLAGKPPRIAPEAMQAAAAAIREKVVAERNVEAERNRSAGEAFLAKNREAEGVRVLDSGVQYREIQAGAGDQPGADDTVVVHYRGKLLDGTEFDSSFGRGEPTEFKVGQVIQGWQDALRQMRPGAEWEVWIPSDLAYGARGAGGKIGPHSTLHFSIQLIEVKAGT